MKHGAKLCQRLSLDVIKVVFRLKYLKNIFFPLYGEVNVEFNF